MELLAPAGSKESLVTAIRAGANAVYMGVEGFNARVSASNINLFDLQVLVDYAHGKNVKVYLALNTLIKHEEISAVVKNINFINKLHADALIVQDLGIANIVRKYFPDIALHASTQMAVHNRPGVDFLAGFGFKRAIMARELSFSELKLITKGSPIGIEIFCHGALCFSLSGMCLFSSFIGGLSGNRGRCTQPCRRIWKNGSKQGYVFSPRDLELAEHINKLKKAGIASLKIEGRMRSSEYVYRVVKAYKMLIDSDDNNFKQALEEAKSILSGDMAREKTTCLLNGRDNLIFQPKKAQCLGNYIGDIDSISGGNITIKALNESVEIFNGDRLRLSNPKTDITAAFKIKDFKKDGLKYTIPFAKSDEFTRGNPVFKTADAAADQKNIQEEIDSIYENFKKNNPRAARRPDETPQAYTALISNIWKQEKSSKTAQADVLWARFDDLQWLRLLPGQENTRCVFYLTKDNMHSAANISASLAIELPPFIAQRETAVYREYIDKMIEKGIDKWVLNNVSQFEFFKNRKCELSAGQFLYTWNAYTGAFLTGAGVKYFTVSWEDDFLNIRKMSAPGMGKYMLVYLYGYPPIVRSRIITRDMLDNCIISENTLKEDTKTSVSFMPVYEAESALLIPEKPFSIFNARRKLKECGISNFGIDLTFIKPDKKFLTSLLAFYKQEENPPDSVKFNFKAGIK